MRLSRIFSKTIKEVPADETAINAKFLIRGGFISKVMAGVYNYLPLGLKVLDKINNIIREEINKIGGEELHMSVLQNKDIWNKTGRWDSAKEVMYQFKDASGKETGLGWTHEEPITEIGRHFISSYKDLPRAVYQIQTKFRNEPRAKSGLLRGREFLMKDLYSFHVDDRDLDIYYEQVAGAYDNIFRRCGLDARRTLASGGLFSKFSDEFQVITSVGEDTIFYCNKCRYAANKEVASELKLQDKCPQCDGKLVEGNSVEVGNIFKLGIRFSEAFDLTYSDQSGDKKAVVMASYGIGPGRVLATVIEVSHDEKGIIWPESIAPFKLHLIALDGAYNEAEEIYKDMLARGVEILYDDRQDKTPGEKFADADLIGCPIRLLVSSKSLEKHSLEVKKRVQDEPYFVDLSTYSEEI